MVMQQKIQHDAGFVLFITLIFLQLFAFIAMESMALVLDGKHTLRLMFQQHYQQAMAEALIARIKYPLAPSCISGVYPSAFLIRQPLSWWQAHACHGQWQGNDYYYLQEPLARAVCNQENKPVRYDRNTLLYLQGNDFYSAVIYQSIITNANSANIPCQGEPKAIALGVHMMRQLY